jgi:DNA relaxase NicK
VIESQVDWLTCSTHGEHGAAKLLDLARGLAADEIAHGARSVPWRSQGYVGKHAGRVEWGQRDRNATMLRLSGDAAAKYLDPALALATHVTRLDIAVTYQADPPDPLLGRNTYTLAEMFHQKNPRSALPWFVGDAAKGYTCYIGKRRSENFFRLYNKEAESIAADDDDDRERYRACWRYELEVKGTVALPLAETVNSQENQPAYIQRYLYQWAQAHGIEPAFGQFGGRVLIPGLRRRSDALTKLKHLEKNVRPTVDWLREVGRMEDVLLVLGISKTEDSS